MDLKKAQNTFFVLPPLQEHCFGSISSYSIGNDFVVQNVHFKY